MTMKERITAVITGEEHDRVPFVQYDGMAGDNREIWKVVGRDRMGILRWTKPYLFEHPNCRFVKEDIELHGRKGLRTTLITPVGRLEEERYYEPAFGTSSIREHFVRDPEDYRVLLFYLKDLAVVDNLAEVTKALSDVGDDGLLHINVGRTPYQRLWVQWVGIQDLSCHLADCPDRVEECMALMGDALMRTVAVVERAPVPYIVIGDNITAPVIGRDNFRKHCLPYYREIALRLSARNKRLFVHMDGDLKPLWNEIGESKVGGIDSLSPPPDNDTSAGDAVSLWPDMRIFLNFPSSVHLSPPEEIYRHAVRILEEAGGSGRLEIQISENVPPGRWRTSFPEIVRAIDDFGRPGGN